MRSVFDREHIEKIALEYYSSSSAVTREKLLQKAFTLYQPLILKYIIKYKSISCLLATEDLELLVKEGIWLGLSRFTPGRSAVSYIHFSIKESLNKELQVALSKKRTSIDYQSADVTPEVYENLETSYKEDVWIIQYDLQQAIDKLPGILKTIVKLWSENVHYLDICKFTGLKDAQVYNYINEGKRRLAIELDVYLGDI